MTSFNLRFLTPFAVAAGLMLVLVACGNKVELPQTEAAAIDYVKSEVLAFYHQHPDKVAGDCPLFLNLAIWGARKDRYSERVRWTVHAVGTGLPMPQGAFDAAAWKRFSESQGGEAKYWILEDGRVIAPFVVSGLSMCSGALATFP